MKLLLIEATEFTPKVWFRPDYNVLEVSGFSRPENVSAFYTPIMEYINEYEKEILDSPQFKFGTLLKVQFKLKYFNSASSKFILDIINTFVEFEDKGLKVIFEWYYDEGDDTILESGEDLSDISDVPFHYIKNKETNI